MSEESRRAADEWKKAEQALKEAEGRLKLAWQAYFSKQGRAPGADLVSEVSRLRLIANDKLQEAIRLAHPDARPSRPS